MTDFIDHLSVKQYGCLKEVELELSPLHALIGPNDSGKSTILRAIRTVAQFGAGPFTPPNGAMPFNPGLDGSSQYEISAHFHDADITYAIVNNGGQPADDYAPQRRSPQGRFGRRLAQSDQDYLRNRFPDWDKINALLKNGPRLLRLDPDALRAASTLIPTGEKSRLFDERGRGLPAIYDVLVNQNVEAFLAIKERVRELFPSIKSIGLNNVSSSTKVIQAQLTSGEWVSAEFMSEGLLYYLAFAALPYVDPPSILLVEEPENGLHPARIHEVMHVLREVSKTTQVLIATHNPLVVNELAPEEVSVVTRHPDTGTRVVRIDKTPDFEDRFKVYGRSKRARELCERGGIPAHPGAKGGARRRTTRTWRARGHVATCRAEWLGGRGRHPVEEHSQASGRDRSQGRSIQRAPRLPSRQKERRRRPCLIAIAGTSGSEIMRRPEDELASLGVGLKDTTAMVDFVADRGLARVAKDATSLNRWLERARVVFASLDPG